MSAKSASLGEDMLMARWGDSLETISMESFPQLPYVFTATGMQVHPNSRHFGPLFYVNKNIIANTIGTIYFCV